MRGQGEDKDETKDAVKCGKKLNDGGGRWRWWRDWGKEVERTEW